jgi:hypothetical protein
MVAAVVLIETETATVPGLAGQLADLEAGCAPGLD